MEITGSRRFGRYLKRLRERKRLSLDKVEELSHDQPERVTRSHLSRIENGKSLPTLPRLMTLSRLYGQKVSDLTQRLEFDVQFEKAAPIDLTGRSLDELEAEARLEAERGELIRAFHLLEAAADLFTLRGDGHRDPEHDLKIQLKLSTVLIRSGKLNLATEYAEAAISRPDVSIEVKSWALMNLARIHRRQGRPVLCRIMVDCVLEHGDSVMPYHTADAKAMLGALAGEEGNFEAAGDHYAASLALYRELKRPYEECGALEGLARSNLERKRLGQAGRYAELQLALARKHKFQSEEGWGLQLHALIAEERGETSQAEAHLRQSNEIARKIEHDEMLYTNHFHQWRLAVKAKDEARAASLKRILRKLRTEVEDQTPGILACVAELGEDHR